MIMTKIEGYGKSVRKLYANNGSEFGVYGTVEELAEDGIIFASELKGDKWLFISKTRDQTEAGSEFELLCKVLGIALYPSEKCGTVTHITSDNCGRYMGLYGYGSDVYDVSPWAVDHTEMDKWCFVPRPCNGLTRKTFKTKKAMYKWLIPMMVVWS